jgi:hypothetical protein
MAVGVWVEVVAWYLSVPVIGNADLKDVDITTSPKTSAASDVAQAARVQPLWLTLDILLQWILLQIMEWVMGQWQVPQAQGLLLQQPVASVQAVDMVVNILVAHPVPMLSHLVSALLLAHTPLSTLILVQLEALTLLVPSTAVLLRPLFNLPAMGQLPPAQALITSTIKVKAIPSHSSPRALATSPWAVVMHVKTAGQRSLALRASPQRKLCHFANCFALSVSL